MTGSAPDKTRVVVLGSKTLQRLHEAAPPDQVTLRWVLHHLQNQSFGIILVLLAIAAVVPGICTFAGFLIAFVAFQIAVGRHAPYFPDWVANRPLPTRRLGAVVTRAIPFLKVLEKGVYPRWPRMIAAMRPALGIVIIMLSLRLILVPVPLSNILPALVILLISLAYLEEDGISITISIAAGLGMLAIDSVVLLGVIRGQS
jgi:hypothetical protein